MMKKLIYTFVFVLLAFSCKEKVKQNQENTAKPSHPIVSDDGLTISFQDSENAAFFTTETVETSEIEADFTAPGKIAATVLPSSQGNSQTIVLFDNPELAGNYTELIQHQININQIQNINIRQKQLELERTQDLIQHGTATGQELLNIQTELAMEQTNLENEKAALIEHEVKLKSEGFNPEILQKARPGTAYVICGIPENHISGVEENQDCEISFTSFPHEVFTGKIDAVADLVDNETRMVKVRILVKNATSKLKSGMFANVSFKIREGNFVSIDKSTMITIQGKHYVFLKKSPGVFERTEIKAGRQIGDRIIVYAGLNDGDKIANQGVMQLKALSFGY